MGCGNFNVDLRWVREGSSDTKFKERELPQEVLVLDVSLCHRNWNTTRRFFVSDVKAPPSHTRRIADEIVLSKTYDARTYRALLRFFDKFGEKQRGPVPAWIIDLAFVIHACRLMHENSRELNRIIDTADDATQLRLLIGLAPDAAR